MKARCPHCQGGCDHCEHTGFVDVTLACGPLFTRKCGWDGCGFENGGRILTEEEVAQGLLEPPGKPGPCVRCGNRRVAWLQVGTIQLGDKVPENLTDTEDAE